jgi:pimeloyl-ACP methyl ester carboxylesterase/DNA-binding CsgD family transcriptional regulator
MTQQIRFCKTMDGVQLAYAVMGQGYPIVKAANWLSHLEFECESPVWRHWWSGLSEQHTLIRYDERGCGLSDWDVSDFSFDAWVRDLETVIDAVALDRFALLGVSQGGAVAIAYALKYPEKVSHLILYGAFAKGQDIHLVQKPEDVEMFGQFIRLGWGQDNPAFRQLFTSLFIPEGALEQSRWFNDLQRISCSPENAARFFHQFTCIDVCELAAQVQIPTLVLHAQEDALVPFRQGRSLATLIPNARLISLNSKNHILLEEPAWQRFISEVQAFLKTVSQVVSQAEDKPQAQLAESIHSIADIDSSQLAELLTEREQEILELIAQGLSNAQIGERLVLSPKTVRNHITHIFSKLQVTRRAEAIVRARDAGFGSQSLKLQG